MKTATTRGVGPRPARAERGAARVRAALPRLLSLAPLVLAAACAREPAPNVLLLVVDTLRADSLESYGYERSTSPNIDRLLADRGVVVDRAYVDAPWTLPSMAAMFTGQPSSDLTDEAGSPIGIPEAAQTLAELLTEGGYATAGFVANATMDDHNGYAQGFSHYQTPPLDEALHHHAGKLNEEALSYLEEHLAASPGRPFFLWLHYLDPHDPYLNSDLVDGKSKFYPDYRGHLTGGDAHALELGRELLRNPQDDIRHLRALYDSEVGFVDRHIGHLLDRLGREVLRHTLVILTSDHGEEFYEHGGFKHGQTLYEEQLRVPWIWRWDGELPPGRRVAGPASLLDLVPTVASALGLSPRDELTGVDLLPLLQGEEQVAPEALQRQRGQLLKRQLFFRHLAPGPERFATLRGDHKQIFFDRQAPFESGGVRGDALWQSDVARLERYEVYDLAADPQEAHPIHSVSRTGTGTEAFCRLDPWLDGLRVLRPSDDDPNAEMWSVRLVSSEEPGTALRVRSLFLGPDDQVEIDVDSGGTVITLRLQPDQVPKGILLSGDLSVLDLLETTTASGRRVQFVDNLDRHELRKGDCALLGAADGVALWLRPGRRLLGERDVSDEQRKALEALGYS